MGEDLTSNIPIVDFSSWKPDSSPAQRLAVAKDLVSACRDVGFVYIVNHGVAPDLLEEAFNWSKKLFDLKTEEKMLAPHPPGPTVHRGYSWPGLEKVSQVISSDIEVGERLRDIPDCKVHDLWFTAMESYEIGSEENEEQPNVWIPEETLPGFRAFMTAFYWQCSRTEKEILKALAVGLQLADENILVNYHSGHNNQLRLLHYPPVPAAALEQQSTARMPAHSDWGSITMLFQDDCGGLQVENPHAPGEFIEAHPIKNAIVMNVGDLLMRWSNDQLKSTLHRVTMPPLQDRFTGTERMTRARYSIPYFVSPDLDSVIECLPECADKVHPVKYGPIIQREYRLMRAKLQYRERPVEVAAVAG